MTVWSVPEEGLDDELRFSSKANLLAPVRRNIDVRGRSEDTAFVIDNALSAEECEKLVAVTERLGYTAKNLRINKYQNNKALYWYANDAILQPIFDRIQHLLPQHCNGRKLYGRWSHRLHMYKYDDGDNFKKHLDGQGPIGAEVKPDLNQTYWPGQVSQYTALVYISGVEDGLQGGATRCYYMSKTGRFVDVKPRKGSILYFRHGRDESVLHQGMPVRGDVPKYVVRSSLLYNK